jgi:hypothetical protein
MKTIAFNVNQTQLWRLSPDRRSVRMQLPPLKIARSPKPIDIHLDFETETVDEILQRLTELRAQMLPPPVRQ